jgi:hypothetical protein
MKRMAYSGALATTWTLATALLGALVWSGCSVQAHGGGDVYCDKTGCYECDGYSCTSVSGPSGSSDTSGGSSSGSQASVDSGAASVTPSDAGQTPADASPADAAPPPPPDCVTTADCRSEVSQSCVGGYCRYTCTSNRACAEIDARLDVCNGTDAAPGYCVSSAE